MLTGPRVSVRLVREGAAMLERPRIGGPADVERLLIHLRDLDREVFCALHLDGKHRLISYEEVSRGSLTSTLVHPREVFKAAILVSAAAILVAHNHPSGDPTPSAEDVQVARRLREAGELLGIPLVDSIVIGAVGCHSLREHGWG
jgi:DNA repair protein RadC